MTYYMFNQNSEKYASEDKENVWNGTKEEKYRQDSSLYTKKNL